MLFAHDQRRKEKLGFDLKVRFRSNQRRPISVTPWRCSLIRKVDVNIINAIHQLQGQDGGLVQKTITLSLWRLGYRSPFPG